MKLLMNLSWAFFLLSGCGGSSGGSGGGTSAEQPSPIQSMIVADQSQFPACETSRAGSLAYSKADAKFYACDSGAWTEVSIKGEKGDAGTAGTAGASGISLASLFQCSKVTGGRTFDYSSALYSSGDRWVKCTISDSSASYTETQLYKSTQNAATTGGCLLMYDLDTSSSGFWNFSINSTTKTAVYTDSGSASNNTTVTFSTSDCTSL